MGGDGDTDELPRGGKWEDEEERRFFEDIQDLRDFVPKSVLGFTETGQVTQDTTDSGSIKDDLDRERREREESEAKELEKELKRLELEDGSQNKAATNDDSEIDASEEEYVYYYNN